MENVETYTDFGSACHFFLAMRSLGGGDAAAVDTAMWGFCCGRGRNVDEVVLLASHNRVAAPVLQLDCNDAYQTHTMQTLSYIPHFRVCWTVGFDQLKMNS
jgi:hypothetical protein